MLVEPAPENRLLEFALRHSGEDCRAHQVFSPGIFALAALGIERPAPRVGEVLAHLELAQTHLKPGNSIVVRCCHRADGDGSRDLEKLCQVNSIAFLMYRRKPACQNPSRA
jgi:hypothetical protein